MKTELSKKEEKLKAEFIEWLEVQMKSEDVTDLDAAGWWLNQRRKEGKDKFIEGFLLGLKRHTWMKDGVTYVSVLDPAQNGITFGKSLLY